MRNLRVVSVLFACLSLVTCSNPTHEAVGVTRLVSLLPEAEIKSSRESLSPRRGRQLPVGDPWDADAPSTRNYIVRDAIPAPAPTTISFRLALPENARLAFAYGMAKESSPGDGARFRVLVSKGDGVAKTLFEDELSIEEGATFWHWEERTLPLKAFSGHQAQLTFETTQTATGQSGEALWGSPEVYVPRRRGDPPNVILIAVDTLRADRLSCYGYRAGATPNIDSLAADGIRFDQAIASSNWTTPSFAATFTGQNRLENRGGLQTAEAQTIAEAFQSAGWSTGAILYKAALYDRGFERGFDYSMNAPRSNVRADENLRQGLAWIKKNRDRRFFLFLHFNDPHQPFCQPDSEIDESIEDRLDHFGLSLPIKISNRSARMIDLSTPDKSLKKVRGCKSCKQNGVLHPDFKCLASDLYDNAVHYTDTRLGDFLEALKEYGLYEDSLIVFFSDHGEALWNHGEQYSHGKANLHDELIRVPLIMKPPAGERWARGRTVSPQVRLIDLKSTVLEVAGLEDSASHGEAMSLVPALMAQEKWSQERPAFSFNRKYNVFSLRYRGWKYIRFYPDKKIEHFALREELYDLSSDPGERVNVIEQAPKVLDDLRFAMDGFTGALSRSREEAAQPEVVDEYQLRALKALGYLR